MSDNPFKPATKHDAFLRMALTGPSGSGKTFTALALATALGKTAVLDTERGSAKKYADLFTFDVLEIDQFSPVAYIRALKLAEEHGYAVVVLDSLSHAWFGEGGVLDIVEKEKLKGGNRNEFAAWRIGTEKQNDLVAAILGARLHVIGTMRSKTEYIVGEDKKPRKVGLAPVQRDGFEYEFDVLAALDIEHNMMIEKTRCITLDGKVFAKPGAEVADILRAWLTVDAASVKPAPAPVVTTPTPAAVTPPAVVTLPMKDGGTLTMGTIPFTNTPPAVEQPLDIKDLTPEEADKFLKRLPAPEASTSAMDEHFGLRPATWDPAEDVSPLDAGSWAKLNGWMCLNMPNIEAPAHAANALWASIGEHIEDLLEDERAQATMRVVVEERSFARLFKAKLPIADVLAAIQAHYEEKSAARKTAA